MALKIIEFHDVLCSWCFVAASRLRQLEKEYGDQINLIYKVFPLGPDRKTINYMFGSPEAAKAEILTHWEASKRLPGGEEINPELMRRRPFPYPYSMPALMAVKAAEAQAGLKGHQLYYDRAQRAHLVECRNVADRQVLIDIAKELGLDMEKFKSTFESQAMRQAVMADRDEALTLGIHETPTVVIDSQIIAGAVPVKTYKEIIDKVLQKTDNDQKKKE